MSILKHPTPNPYLRDRLGRFKANATARAMRHVRWLWQLAEWKAMVDPRGSREGV